MVNRVSLALGVLDFSGCGSLDLEKNLSISQEEMLRLPAFATSLVQ